MIEAQAEMTVVRQAMHNLCLLTHINKINLQKKTSKMKVYPSMLMKNKERKRD